MSSSALGSAKAVWDQRRGARTTGDLAYVLYLAVMTMVVIGGPIARVAVQGLARPDVLPGLLSAAAPGMTTALWLLICAGLVLLGRTRGPAVLSPFFAATLAWSAMPRRVALTWPFLRGTAAVTAGFAVLCAVVGLTLETTGRVDLGAVALFALAGSGAGMLAAACWLGGQVLGGGSARILAAVLVAGPVTTSLLAVPWGPGSAYPTLDTAVPWAFGLLGLGGIAVACSLPVLNRIRGQVLAEQARRWDEATVSATTGDLATAAAGYRALPTAGRRLPVVGSGLLVILYARRDLLALLRTPERSLVGAAGVLAAAFVLAQAMTLTGPVAVTGWIVGGVMLWAASGVFVDGTRHAVHTLGAPTLFGQQVGSQMALHAVVPTLLLTVLSGAGAAVSLAQGGSVAAPAVLVPLLLVPVTIIGRLRDAAKGPMPLKLLAPMPTAAGDMSALMVLMWQVDAVLLALVWTVLLAVAAAAGPPWAAPLVAAAAIGVTLMGLRARLRDLRAT